MDVCRLVAHAPQEEAAWDAFVKSSSDGTVFHLIAWKRLVEDVFGHRPHYLYATDATGIRAILPLFEVNGLLSGRVLVSVPYGVYGGLCGADHEARERLMSEARRLVADRRARHVELRQLHGPMPNLPTKSVYVSFRRSISPDPEVNMLAIPGKQRRWVRKGTKNGLEVSWGWEPLDAFYDIFTRNMHRLGSPAFPARAFATIRDYFGDEAALLTVWHEKRLVAGVQVFYFRDQVLPYYAAASHEALHLGVNDFMYWELICQAARDGYRTFDFSRSRIGSGSYEFKRHWGFTPEPLAYQYLFLSGGDIPNLSPSNPRLKLLIETWKRLPVPVTRWLGPVLTKRLPVD